MWFKVDDGMPSHPKTLSIPRAQRCAAMGLWALAGAWASRNLTDGQIPEYMISELAGTPKLADLLVKSGLWERTDDGYQFHDFEDHNPSKEIVEQMRSDKATAAVIANHNRWHKKRGITDLKCPQCREERASA